MTRSKSSASRVFGGEAGKLPEGLELVEADARDPRSLAAALAFPSGGNGNSEGVAAVACCTGTTAFPSKRWQGDNGPRQTDEVGTRNLVEAAKEGSGPALKRFVLVSSAGVLVSCFFFSFLFSRAKIVFSFDSFRKNAHKKKKKKKKKKKNSVPTSSLTASSTSSPSSPAKRPPRITSAPPASLSPSSARGG